MTTKLGVCVAMLKQRRSALHEFRRIKGSGGGSDSGRTCRGLGAEVLGERGHKLPAGPSVDHSANVSEPGTCKSACKSKTLQVQVAGEAGDELAFVVDLVVPFFANISVATQEEDADATRAELHKVVAHSLCIVLRVVILVDMLIICGTPVWSSMWKSHEGGRLSR